MCLAAGVFLLARRCFPTSPGMARLSPTQRFRLASAAFIGGVFGAKLPFALDAELAPSSWLADGKTIVTGLIGAYLAVEVAKKLLGIRVKTGDAYALPLALALAIGRWGCFFNGCCYGTPTNLPWAVDFGDGVARHPTQVYESLFHLAMAGALIVLVGRGLLAGNRLKFYLIGYAAYRFATEFIRPEPAVALGLTFYQWASLALAAGLAIQWWCEAEPRDVECT